MRMSDGAGTPMPCAHCGRAILGGHTVWVSAFPYHPECTRGPQATADSSRELELLRKIEALVMERQELRTEIERLRAALEEARANALEEAAGIAEKLGGDRYDPDAGRNADRRTGHGRATAHIEAQHLRAKTIAAAIRARKEP